MIYMIDTSWKNNKKSLYGLGAMLVTWVGLGLIGIGGIISLALGFAAFFLGYRYADKRAGVDKQSHQ